MLVAALSSICGVAINRQATCPLPRWSWSFRYLSGCLLRTGFPSSAGQGRVALLQAGHTSYRYYRIEGGAGISLAAPRGGRCGRDLEGLEFAGSAYGQVSRPCRFVGTLFVPSSYLFSTSAQHESRRIPLRRRRPFMEQRQSPNAAATLSPFNNEKHIMKVVPCQLF